MRKTLMVLGVALLAAGCGSSSSGSTPASSSAPPVTATSAAIPAGPVDVQIGQQFDVRTPKGVDQALVTITAVEADPTCTTRYGEPDTARGHYAAVELDVQAAPTISTTEFSYLSGYDFAEVRADGYTAASVYAADDRCIADRDGFNPLSPGGKYRGWVLIDVSALDSKLTFQPHMMAAEQGAGSWRFAIPAPAAAAAPEGTVEPTSEAPPASTGSAAPTTTEPDIRQGPEPDSGYGEGAGGYDEGPLPGPDGSYRTSADIMTEYGCQQGYITGDVCAKYR